MALEGNAEIDPVKYGVLWQKVQDMDKKMDKMERQMEQLIDMANHADDIAKQWFNTEDWGTPEATFTIHHLIIAGRKP